MFKLALATFNSGDLADEFRAKAVCELVSQAIALKNVELHVQLMHTAPKAPLFGGGQTPQSH